MDATQARRAAPITVAFDVAETDWKLSISDNGVGKPDDVFAQPKTGLGTGIVKALAKQLDAQVVTKFRLSTRHYNEAAPSIQIAHGPADERHAVARGQPVPPRDPNN